MVDVRLGDLPQDQPWSRVGWRLVCKVCGVAGAVHVTPNWHDMGGRVPFSERDREQATPGCRRGRRTSR